MTEIIKKKVIPNKVYLFERAQTNIIGVERALFEVPMYVLVKFFITVNILF